MTRSGGVPIKSESNSESANVINTWIFRVAYIQY